MKKVLSIVAIVAMSMMVFSCKNASTEENAECTECTEQCAECAEQCTECQAADSTAAAAEEAPAETPAE